MRLYILAIIIALAAATSFAAPTSFSLLSLNTALLPPQFGFDIGMGRTEERAFYLAEKLLRLDETPDVIVLQEAFDDYALYDYFYSRIRHLYPFAYFDQRMGGWLVGVHSGLAILSKHPIERAGVESFTCFVGIEAMTQKGIMGAKIRVQGKPLYVFTTHMQAGKTDGFFKYVDMITPKDCGKYDSEDTDQVGLHELEQASRFISRFTKNTKSPIIYAGDFNISTLNDADVYAKIFEIFPNATDTFDAEVSDLLTTVMHKKADVDDRIDFVFLINQPKNFSGFSYVFPVLSRAKVGKKIIDLTDHWGVWANFWWTDKGLLFGA